MSRHRLTPSPASGIRPALVVAAVMCAALCGCGPDRESAGAREPGAQGAAAPPPAAAAPPEAGEEQAEVILYFADAEGRLQPEKREVAREVSGARQAHRVIQALVEGPHGDLSPVLPPDTAVRALHLGADGTAYVDFDAAFAKGLSRGSEDALLAVWSLTDTLAANFPSVRQVKILVEGEEVRDLGGHLDLSRPLTPDMSLVSGQVSAAHGADRE